MDNPDKITIKDVINSFKYEGVDISPYIEKMQVASTGERVYSTDEKPVLVTTFTFSCTNILFYNDSFSYLLHMDPAETTGKKILFAAEYKKL